MKKQLGVLAVSVLTASIAQGNSFVIQDAVGNAMGGAGVANDATVGYGNNPALLINDERDHFAITLPSVGIFIEDGQGFIPSIEKFVSEDIDTFTNLDLAGLPTAITEVNTAVSAVDAAAAAYALDPTAAKLAIVADENAVLTSKISNVSTQVNSVTDVVTTTQDAFNSFSGKPMQAGLLAGLGLAIPNIGFPMSVTASNNAYLGFQFGLVAADLAPANDTLSDVSEYVTLVEAVSARNADVVAAAAAVQAILDDPGYTLGDEIAPLAALDAAQIALVAAQNDLAVATTTNGVFTGGTFTGPAGSLDVNTLTSSIDLLMVNVTEVGFASARELEISDFDFVTGVNLKAQYIIASGGNVSIADMSNDATGALNSIVGATESHMVFNADIGFTKEIKIGFGTLASAVVIKDVIPYTLTAPTGEITIKPAIRAGLSHQTGFTTLVADLDLTKNTPIGYGSPTQYFNIGGEFSLFGLINARAGLKNNLAGDNDRAVTLGTGAGLLGIALDFSGWFNPTSNVTEITKNAGFMAQFSTQW